MKEDFVANFDVVGPKGKKSFKHLEEPYIKIIELMSSLNLKEYETVMILDSITMFMKVQMADKEEFLKICAKQYDIMKERMEEIQSEKKTSRMPPNCC